MGSNTGGRPQNEDAIWSCRAAQKYGYASEFNTLVAISGDLILSSSHDDMCMCCCVHSTEHIRNDPPEMSNGHEFGAPETSGTFHAAHDFTMHNATFNDVQGNYVRDHFVACIDRR